MVRKLRKQGLIFNLSLVIIFFFMVAGITHAAPLKNIPMALVQPDGTILECYASGDEFINYFHDKDGNIIIQDEETGYYVYASYTKDELRPTSIIPNKSGKLKGLNQIANKNAIQFSKKNLTPIKHKMAEEKNVQKAPSTGTMNNIIIFIKFKDEEEFLTTDNQYETYLNNDTPGANSLYNYYKEVSNGQLSVISHCYPREGQRVASYTASQPRGYYSSYSAVNTIGYKTEDEGYERLHMLLTSAVNYVDANNQVPASLNIDRDGDGEIDGLTFILSGDAYSSNDLLWPHKWNLYYGVNASINGKQAWTYNIQLSKFMDKTSGGVFPLAHELFHCMGAPDLYRYYDSGDPVGPWDLMADTVNVPPHMTTYMKYQYGHWLDSIPEIKTSGTYSLNPLISNENNAYKIRSSEPDQYYILEYRKRQGTYENVLPSEGLLVYRVNTSIADGNMFGKDDTYASKDEVYIYRPNNSDLNLYLAPLNTANGKTAISTHEMFTSTGKPADFNISNVSIQNGTLSFDVNMEIEEPIFSIPDNAKFYGEIGVTIFHPNPEAEIYYTTDGELPDDNSTRYTPGEKIFLSETTRLMAVAYIDGVASPIKDTTYQKVITVESTHPYQADADEWWVIGFRGAKSIQLTFDKQTRFDRNDQNEACDTLSILSEDGKAIEGSPFGGVTLAGKTVEVDGSHVFLHFKSDSIHQQWGFYLSLITPKYASRYQGEILDLSNGEIISGICQINGWCINTIGISTIELLIDDVVYDTVSRIEVPTLKDRFPDYNTSQAGFTYDLDTTDLVNGNHKIAIRATGLDGTSYILGPVTVTVNNTSKYQSSIWAPASGETVSGVKQINGWCINEKGISKIELLVDDVSYGTASRFEVPALKDMFPGYNTSQAGFSYNLDTRYLPNGSHQIALKATGTDGTSHIIGPVTITVNNASKYQSSIWAPASGEAVSGVKQINGWCINEKGISKIELLVDNVSHGVASRFEVPALKDMFPGYNTSQAGFAYNFDTRVLTNGTHQIAIKATGTDGTSHIIGPVTITVNNASKYQGAMWSPASGETVSGVTQVSGWCINERGISKMELLIDGGVCAPASRFEVPALKDMFAGYNTSQAGFVFYLDTKYLTNATHQIAIKATGTDGTSYIVGPVTININNPSKVSDIKLEAETKPEPAPEKDSEEESRLQPERKSQAESEEKTEEEPETVPDAELKTESEIESDSGSETEPKLMISEERMITGTVDGLSSDPISGVHTIQGMIAYADQQIKLELLVDGEVFDNIDFELDEDFAVFEYDFDTMRFEDGKYRVTLQVVTSSGKKYVIEDIEITIINNSDECIWNT